MKVPIPRILFATLMCSLYSICLVFVLDHLDKKNVSESFVLVVCFISVIIVFIVFLFTKRIVFYGEMGDKEIKRMIESEKKEVGNFHYSEDGFTYANDVNVKWNEVTRVVVVKEETFSVDRIKLILQTQTLDFTISEDEKGWYVFIQKMSSSLNIQNLFVLIFSIDFYNSHKVIWEKL